VAARHNLPIHMDGARVFDAAVALGIDVREITRYVDSIQFCLTKGLSAPLGSILAGTQVFIERARRVRQMLGGEMRQAGIIAAAGIVALETMIERLAEDHANARALAEGVTQERGLRVDLSSVQTNMVYVDVAGAGLDGTEAVRLLASRGVKTLATGPSTLRFVFYRGIQREDVEYAIAALRDVVETVHRRDARLVDREVATTLPRV
jgi:threonine aldolase